MAGEAAQGGEPQGSIFGTMFRVVVIYVSINTFFGGGLNKSQAGVQPVPQKATSGLDDLSSSLSHDGHMAQPQGAGGAQLRPAQPQQIPPTPLANAFNPGQLMDLRMYISETQEFSAFSDTTKLIWQERSMAYSRDEAAASTRALNITINPSKAVQRNESGMWAHIYVSKAGMSPDPSSHTYDLLGTAVAHAPLIKVVKRKRPKMTRNLLSGEVHDPAPSGGGAKSSSGGKDAAGAGDVATSSLATENAEDEPPEVEWIPHWKPALTIQLVEDSSVYPSAAHVPVPMRPSLIMHPSQNRYMPVIYVNEFWIMADRYIPVNETLAELPLELSFSVTTLMRWMLTEQMQQSLKQQTEMHGDATVDEMRRMFAETSPWLLAVTAVVSMLHTLFDVLAFKNDISFWKNNKSMKGLSFRSMIINVFFQTVIFLYLMDNDTSYMILVSSGVGLAIEFWKCKKAIKSITFERREGSSIPSLLIVPADSYTLSPTKLYDDEAMRYLSHAMYPLVVGYSAYSLAYGTHKSWYSWILGAMVNFVYTFGFVLMTPQLFINYKLKSTAHMPWKTFMYKALNTFIDDLFAFIIKMPTMHRLSCLRDDLIFVIYLYQRWAYGVDKKRANEFGQVGEDLDENGHLLVAKAEADVRDGLTDGPPAELEATVDTD